MNLHELVLLPEVAVRRILADSPLRVRMIVPPFPAAGAGALRVLRAQQHGAEIELACGYERYDRTEAR